MYSHAVSAVALLCTSLLLAGCAATKLDSQWADPQFQGRSLRGATVFVVCEAGDATTKSLCQDQLAAQVAALGATPQIAGAIDGPRTGREQPTSIYLPAARAAKARAVFSAAVSADPGQPNSGPSIGIGVGGYGGGRVGVGGGVGISLPIGGGERSSGQVMNAALTDVDSGRLMWSGNASTPPASNAAQQGALAKAVGEAAQKAGFF